MLIISEKIREKLWEKHQVTPEMVREAFASSSGRFLRDSREQHDTDPPTQWFIAETDYGLKLKVCFIFKDNKIFVKTAYRANQTEIQIYNKKA